MSVLVDNLWRIGFMLLLVGASAFFSGSETAFFNLSQRQLRNFRKSDNKLHKMILNLLRSPERLLTSILLGNMTVNVLFFSLASVLSINLSRQLHPSAMGIVALITFFLLLLGGEMLPKSLAYSNSSAFCQTAAPLCYLCVRIFHPLVAVFDFLTVRPLLRLMIGPIRTNAESATSDQFKLILKASSHQGLITDHESELLTEVLEFGLLKVPHVMVHRVDMPTCTIDQTRQQIRQLMLDNNLNQLPLCDGDIENIVGMIHLRDMLLHPDKPLKSIATKPCFVPEQKTVESVLSLFHRDGIDSAIVVDEYGGITGIVSINHIIEELFGSDAPDDPDDLVEQLSPMQYRLSGRLPVHEWAELFGIDPDQMRIATIGGLTVAKLGRIAREGDTVKFSNVKVTVEKVSHHRIVTLIVNLQPISK